MAFVGPAGGSGRESIDGGEGGMELMDQPFQLASAIMRTARNNAKRLSSAAADNVQRLPNVQLPMQLPSVQLPNVQLPTRGLRPRAASSVAAYHHSTEGRGMAAPPPRPAGIAEEEEEGGGGGAEGGGEEEGAEAEVGSPDGRTSMSSLDSSIGDADEALEDADGGGGGGGAEGRVQMRHRGLSALDEMSPLKAPKASFDGGVIEEDDPRRPESRRSFAESHASSGGTLPYLTLAFALPDLT